MTEGATLTPDICVVGAGAAGLSVAAGASQLGAETLLVEAGEMGGDCLNVGCVPSKALLAASHLARLHRRAETFGLAVRPPEVELPQVRRHVKDVIETIAPIDSQERFEGLGVSVIRAHARFVSGRELEVDGQRIRARRFVLATGSRPLIPPIPGLEKVSYLTNETVFDLEELPSHLVVVGGGPIGCELGQAFAGLGARVTVVEQADILPKDDPELVGFVRDRLLADGVTLREGWQVVRTAARDDGGVALELRTENGRQETLEASHLLLAAGRRPALEDLGLETAGIAHDRRGVTVDRGLRTSNRRVFAIGDCAGGPLFTHVGAYHASVVIKRALFRWPARVDYRALPWVTYTRPELAQVGMTEAMARQAGERFEVLRWPFHENDRAQCERETAGALKALVRPNGRILGCGIAGPQAGELIHLWTLAIANKLKIGALAQMIAPYPTLGEVSKRAAGSFFAPRLFTERTRRIVRFLARFG